MSTQNTNQNNVAAQLAAIEAICKQMATLPGMDADAVAAHRQTMLAGLVTPAQSKMKDDLMKVLTTATAKISADTQTLLRDKFFDFRVRFTPEGVTVEYVAGQTTRKPRAQGDGEEGEERKRQYLVVDGLTFETWADLCRHRNLPVKGDSAARVYRRTHRANPAQYKLPAEIEPEVFSADPSKYPAVWKPAPADAAPVAETAPDQAPPADEPTPAAE